MATMSRVVVTLVLVLLAATVRAQISNDLYFRAPPLYHLDDYERCLYRGGSYCLGEFQLWSDGNSTLYDELVEISSDRYVLNRTLLHRGLCLSSCSDGDEHEPAAVFERCLDQKLSKEYGLRARLRLLHFCKSSSTEPRPVDYVDLLVAAIILLVVLLNAAGTLYDFTRNPDQKPNRLLLAWSLRANWLKLTSFHHGDPRLDMLAPIHGVKVHQTLVVVLAHSALAMYRVYSYDTRLVDQMIKRPGAAILQNGTVVVPTFATITAFGFAYLTLLHFEKTKTTPTLKQWLAIVVQRYLKMTPTVMFVIAVTATWVARVTDGPMWTFVEQLEAACRVKWWTHLLYIDNFVDPHRRCLVQSWFMAVDMQMFVVLAALTLWLATRPQRAPRVLAALYVAVLAALLAYNVAEGIEPMNSMATAEGLRTIFAGKKSGYMMYTAPWTNATSTIHGMFLAFTLYNQQKRGGWNPDLHKWFRVIIWVLCPGYFIYLLVGVPMRYVTNPLYQSVYATFVITVFNALVTFGMWCYINKSSEILTKYLSWRGFQVVARMSLTTLLVHWHINLGSLAAQQRPIEISVYSFMSNWFTGVIMTMLLALPVHLMVELPSQKTVDLLLRQDMTAKN